MLSSTESNSESPLLRLPAEIRNCIWEYVLGGNVRDVTIFKRDSKRYTEWLIAMSSASFPEHSHALLSTCRQIYAETALLTFSTNEFRFRSKTTFKWTRDLSKVQKDLIHTVHFVRSPGHPYQRFVQREQCFHVARDFPIDIFPNIKHIVLEMGETYGDIEMGETYYGVNGQEDPPSDLSISISPAQRCDCVVYEKHSHIDREIREITSWVRKTKPDVHLTFKYLVRNRVTVYMIDQAMFSCGLRK